MYFKRQEFQVCYNITAGAVKASQKGSINGFDYGASVRISCSNLQLKDFPDNVENFDDIDFTDYDEVQDNLYFRIPCDSNEEAEALSRAIRKTLRKGMLSVYGNLPNDSNVVNIYSPKSDVLLKELSGNSPISSVEFKSNNSPTSHQVEKTDTDKNKDKK